MSYPDASVAASEHEIIGAHLSRMREKIVNATVIAFAMVVPLTLVVGLARISEIGFHPVMLLHVGVTVSLVAIALARNRLSTQTKSLALIGMMLLVAIGGVWSFGLATGIFVWFLAAIVMSMYLLGKRAAWFIVFISMAFFILIIGLVQSGQLKFAIDLSTYAYSLKGWITFLSSFAMVSIGLLVAVSIANAEQQDLAQKLVESQKMQALGKLTGGMAHEFNNMLGIVIGNLDLALERGTGDKQMQQSCKAALDAAMHGSGIVRSLLAFSGMERLDPVSSDLNARLVNMIDILRNSMSDAISTSLELAPGLWPVKIDTACFDTLVFNLASNARDVMPAGGELILSTRNLPGSNGQTAMDGLQAGDYVVVEVRDTGSGMSPEVLARIFEPFFSTKPIGQGTGLGLSMALGFVRQSGGDMKVESTPGKGTSVRIYLPRESI